MKILVSNDDGITAPGIAALENAAKDFAELIVVAPDKNQSGVSNALTLHDPIKIERLAAKRIKVFGTPTDCVHLALTGLIEEKFDMVLSGINLGANLGDDVWYSGTVAAAMEGRFLGLPSIAFSLVGRDPQYLPTAQRVVSDLLPGVFSHPLPAGVILNVNIPAVPYEALQGMVVTRLGARHCAEPMVPEPGQTDGEYYRIGPPGEGADAGPGTDFFAMAQNQVSITPLNTDLTNHNLVAEIGGWLERFLPREG
jgi:5'-nucleotidase